MNFVVYECQIFDHLHRVKVFDQAVHLTHGTAGPYGRAAAVPVDAKAFVA
jgi:hypothetical protein